MKCYVLIDLKIGEVAHEHIGQMKLYLGYYTKEINEETDNEPIGLILSEEERRYHGRICNAKRQIKLGGFKISIILARCRTAKK